MKSKKLRILEAVLRYMAIAVLKKHTPIIVGVTGSVGKSSAKEAIALVVGKKYTVRKNEENYNNEIGVPLTIIGAKSGKRSLWGWCKVVWQWMVTMVTFDSYPKVLVLELGIDRPGDMRYLLGFLPVQVGVMTNVSISHLEFFSRIDQIAKEKGQLITHLPKNGTAVLCADDERVMRFQDKTKAHVMTFGFRETAMVQADQRRFAGDAMRFEGYGFKLNYEGKTIPVRLPNVAAEHHISAILAAVAVGIAFKMNLVDIASALKDFTPLPGRMRILSGAKHSRIIDDTYNASPVSLKAALDTLKSFSAPRRIAVLGDMLELGDESEASHARVADWMLEYKVDQVFLVGKRMWSAYEKLEARHFPKENLFWFENPMDASRPVFETLSSGDIVLVKGSQGMRMEKVTEAILEHPEDAAHLLCRQSDDWRQRVFSSPV